MSDTVKTNGMKAWLLASRPKTLTGAAAPVLVGGAMALCSRLVTVIDENKTVYGVFNSDDSFFHATLLTCIIPFALCLLFAFLMQIDANLINDYFDFKKGADREDRLGPERACAQGWITQKAMMRGIWLITILSVCIGVLIMLWRLQWELLIVGALCVIFCFLYTTKLSYLGWGDVLVLVFFGLVPVVFTYYVITGGRCDVSVILASIAMGLATDNLLIVNNYRDRYQDEISGKRTIIVRIISSCRKKYGDELGQKKGEAICRRIYLWLGVAATLMAAAAMLLFRPGVSVYSIAVMAVYLGLHIGAYVSMKTLDGKALNKLLGTTARNIFLFGALMAIGMLMKLI